jgi:ABC-type Fe3+/spermidine/putrescine transport system ATPase subunit
VPIARFLRVSKTFGASRAVDDVSFDIGRGEFFSLLGPSGCGKTTTLRLLAGLEAADPGGEILIAGDPVQNKRPYERGLGMVFQSYALFPHLSVERNVAFGLERHRVARADIPSRVAKALEMVRLDPGEFAQRRPAELSGGQRQRVSLVRALMLEPALVLLDEPLGALDPITRSELQEDLHRTFVSLETTVVLVTHDLGEAAYLGDTLVLLRDGRVVQSGTAEDLVARPADAFVERFVRAQRAIPVEGRR